MNKSFIIKIIIICLVTLKASAIEKVVLFGDSLMAGYGLPNEHHLSVILEQNLKAKGLNIKVINGSVSGSSKEKQKKYKRKTRNKKRRTIIKE